MCWARRRSRSSCKGMPHRRLRRLQGRAGPDLRAVRAGAVRRVHHRGDVRPAGVPPCRCRTARSRKLLALGRAVSRARASGRRLFARQGAARDRADCARPATTSRSICTARWRRSRDYYQSRGIDLGELRPVRGVEEGRPRRHHHALRRRRRLQDVWSRRFPDPVTAFASGWMRVRARARQRGVELPLVISDHADWDGLTRDDRRDRRRRDLGHARPGGRAGALVQVARARSAAAGSRRLWRRGRERRRQPRTRQAEA